jgi:hypothetical protein
MTIYPEDDVLFQKKSGLEIPDYEPRTFAVLAFDVQCKIFDKSRISVV